MKWSVVVCVCAALFCVNESDGFKLLKKLNDYLHPTTSTTVDPPTLPDFENQHSQREDDSRSWEQEATTSRSKGEHSDENTSDSRSSERDGGSASHTNKKYNSLKPEKTKPHSGDSLKPNTYTTITSNNNNEKHLSSDNNNFDNQESRTSTDRNYQSNSDNFPEQSSFSGGFDSQNIKSTTQNYGFDNQNQPDQINGGFINQRPQTTPERNDGAYNSNTNTGSQSSLSSGGGGLGETISAGGSSGGFGSETTTRRFSDSENQNNYDQSSVLDGFNQEKVPSSTPTTDGSYYSNNKPEQSYSGGISTSGDSGGSQYQNNEDQLSVFDNPNIARPTSTTARSDFNNPGNYGDSQNQNHDDQSSIFNTPNNEGLTSTTTIRSDYNNNFEKPSQSTSFDSFDEQTNSKNYKPQNRPDQSYDNFNNGFSTTSSTYDNTNYNEVNPALSSSSGSNTDSVDATSTTSSYGLSETAGGDQHKQTSGSSYSTSITSEKTLTNVNDSGKIIFPDDPSLNPTPETERIYGEDDPHFKHHKGIDSKTPAAVTAEEERRIIDAPSKNCQTGQTWDKKKNVCKPIARK